MQRTIKSFVLRTGRMSNRQQHAFENLSKRYLLTPTSSPWDLNTVFGREADTVVEIGFGMGHSLAEMALSHPELNFVGIEVHKAGIGSLAADLHENSISNVRISDHDAVEVLKNSIADNSLRGVQIFFPDPWPKKKHQKRRLIQQEFTKLVVSKLKKGGFIHCATDWEDYAQQMLVVLSEHPELDNQQSAGGFSLRPESRPLTKFEKRGQRLGHGVWDLIFIRTG